MLQRIYGTSFPKKAMLDDYLHKIEEAKKRDHRRLGKELGLFIIAEEGPGFPFFLPRGMIIRNELEDLWRKEHVRAGYQEIKTPVILNRSLWENRSLDHYRENMYFTTIDEDDYAIKPMNCPGGILVYKEHLHSYRELPIRLGNWGWYTGTKIRSSTWVNAGQGLYPGRCPSFYASFPDNQRD